MLENPKYIDLLVWLSLFYSKILYFLTYGNHISKFSLRHGVITRYSSPLQPVIAE